jgi:hypothetical protein
MNFNDPNERSFDTSMPISENKKELAFFSGFIMNVMIGSILSIPSNATYFASYFRKFNQGEVYSEDFIFYFTAIFAIYLLGIKNIEKIIIKS